MRIRDRIDARSDAAAERGSIHTLCDKISQHTAFPDDAGKMRKKSLNTTRVGAASHN